MSELPSTPSALQAQATSAPEPGAPAMLEVEGLRSGYHGVTVLKGLDFTVGNEIFTVLGANGAGKTTLLATLARLIPLTAGIDPAPGGRRLAAAPVPDRAPRDRLRAPGEGRVRGPHRRWRTWPSAG